MSLSEQASPSAVAAHHQPDRAARFLEGSRGLGKWPWGFLGGFVLLFVLWQGVVAIIVLTVPEAGAMMLVEHNNPAALGAREEAIGALWIMAAGFGPPFLALILWRRFVEKRSAKSLFTAAPAFRWGLVIAAAAVTVGLGLGISALVPASDGEDPLAVRLAAFSATDWALILGAYLAGASVQATFEEVFVRGWMAQHIARTVRSGAVVVVVTAIAFSAMHVGHPGWATFVATFVLGLIYGWSAWRLNGLEAAIGGHVGNNVMSAALLGSLVAGNSPEMTGPEMLAYGLYVLGFVGFVEGWVRIVERPPGRVAAP